MKRGQMAGIIVIFILVAAIVALLLLSKKEEQSGKAIQLPETVVATPEPQEVVSKVLYSEPIQSAPPVPADYCKGSGTARTCSQATTIARQQCPAGYDCKSVTPGWSAEGCSVELHCSAPKSATGIKPATGGTVTAPEDVCITSHSATTCHAARALAQKGCPRGYTCQQTQLGLAPEGCFVELRCVKGTSGIKPQEPYPLDTQPQPYAEGYYRPPPSPSYS